MPLAAVVGITGLAGAAISGSSAKSAANTQAQAEQQAAQIQQQQYAQTRSDLLPYNQAGQAANAQITGMGPFSFAPTEAQLEATPGYQFTLNQGLKSTQNSYAARGLPVSGAAMKGAATYATGLADTTYQNQFSNALQSYQTNLAKLQGQASLGENAAGLTGNYGTQTAQAIGQTAVGAANAKAAGTVGAANAIQGGLGSISNAFLANQFFNPSSGGNIYNSSAVYGSPGLTPAQASSAGIFGF